MPPAASKSDNTLSFDRYCNARFGYCIEYPKGIAIPQPQPTNGDGRIFRNPQGQEVLRVYGRNNTDPDFGNISLEQQFSHDIRDVKEEKEVPTSRITYQKLGKNFFVISGYSPGKLFYQKTILKDGVFAYAILRWDSGDTARFREISNRIFQSFR